MTQSPSFATILVCGGFSFGGYCNKQLPFSRNHGFYALPIAHSSALWCSYRPSPHHVCSFKRRSETNEDYRRLSNDLITQTMAVPISGATTLATPALVLSVYMSLSPHPSLSALTLSFNKVPPSPPLPTYHRLSPSQTHTHMQKFIREKPLSPTPTPHSSNRIGLLPPLPGPQRERETGVENKNTYSSQLQYRGNTV